MVYMAAISSDLTIGDFFSFFDLIPYKDGVEIKDPVLIEDWQPGNSITRMVVGKETSIAQAFLHKERLTQIGKQNNGFEEFDRGLLSIIIDTVSGAVNRPNFRLKKRGQYTGMKMARGASFSLIVDIEHKVCYVPTKVRIEEAESTSYKKFSWALAVPFLLDQTPFFVAYKVNRTLKNERGVFNINEMVYRANEYYEEAKLEKRFSCVPKIHLAFYGTSQRFDQGLGAFYRPLKFRVIEELYTATVNNLSSTVSDTTLLQVMTWLVEGLDELHKGGVVHWDIKWGNALYRYRPDRTIEAKWTDLGFAFQPGIRKDRTGLTAKGYYGSIFCTPPEVFGKPFFCGDFFAADVFALSILFYGLLYKRRPPWYDYLLDFYYKRKVLPSADEQAKFVESIQKLIEEEKRKITVLVPSLRAELEKLTFEMMNPDPDKRLKLPHAAERLRILKQ